jgi:hypothetical protein
MARNFRDEALARSAQAFGDKTRMCPMRLNDAVLVIALAVTPLVGARATDPPVEADKKFAPTALGMEVPVITSANDLDKYVGRVVAITGVVTNTKPPTIIGVWVATPDELRDREAYAVGILTKFVVTKAEHKKMQDDARKQGNLIGIAHPGPGTYYQLHADLNWKKAEARPMPKAKDK